MSARRNSTEDAAIDPARLRENAGRVAELLKAVGNENRLMILCALVRGELSVGALNTQVDLSQSALSQHLARLRRDRYVKTRREGQTVYYSLADDNVRKLIAFLHRTYC